MKTFNTKLITFTMISLSNLAFAESSNVVIDRDLSQVIAHDKSLDLRDEQNKRLIRINAMPLLTKRGTIVVGQQSAQLSNLAISTVSMSLNDIEVVPGANSPVAITLNEHGKIQEPLTITDSQLDQRVNYQLTVAKLRSDYEHPVQPQCTSPYTVVEGDDSWSVKDDVCRYDVLANIHCTPESPNYEASNELCRGTHYYSPLYSCPSGYTLSGNSCVKTVRECRFDPSNGVFYKAGYTYLWDGKSVSTSSGTYVKSVRETDSCSAISASHHWQSCNTICGPAQYTISSTPYCNAGDHLTGGLCRKVTTAFPTYSCNEPTQILLGKVCRKETVTLPTCVPSHPHLDPDNEVCRSYENL